MISVRWFIFSFLISILVGCSIPTISPVEYKGTVQGNTNLGAKFQLVSGEVLGVGSYDPIVTGINVSYEIQHFKKEDQEVFLESLKSQLLKHRVIGFIGEKGDSDILHVAINFVKTEHIAQYNGYRLTVTLLLKFESEVEEKQYEIDSLKGDSFWKKINTTPMDGKSDAAKELLSLVIADIGVFVSNLP